MKILIAYDGSQYADAAIEELRYAGLPRESDVLVVFVADAGRPSAKHHLSSEGPFVGCVKSAEAFTERARAHVQFQFPAWKVSIEVLWGEPAKILHETILRWLPDLVVMGSHGRSAVGRFILGSVSLDVIHHAPCSVRVVRTGLWKADSPQRLLVANDGSPEAMAVVDEVARRSWPEGTEVGVVSVAETLVAPSALVPVLAGGASASEGALEVACALDAGELARLRGIGAESLERLEARGLAVSTSVLEGNPRVEVVAKANRWRADTIFVGSRGLGALDRLLLGSVSTAVVTHARCTVEVVRKS